MQARKRENENLERGTGERQRVNFYIYKYIYINRIKERNAAKKNRVILKKGKEGVGLGRRGKKVGRPCQADCSRAMSQKQA